MSVTAPPRTGTIPASPAAVARCSCWSSPRAVRSATVHEERHELAPRRLPQPHDPGICSAPCRRELDEPSACCGFGGCGVERRGAMALSADELSPVEAVHRLCQRVDAPMSCQVFTRRGRGVCRLRCRGVGDCPWALVDSPGLRVFQAACAALLSVSYSMGVRQSRPRWRRRRRW